jgi:hypothetical protein
LASSRDRVYLRVHSSVRRISFHWLTIPINCHFTPGSWLTESDWIPAKPRCLAQNMGQYSWD